MEGIWIGAALVGGFILGGIYFPIIKSFALKEIAAVKAEAAKVESGVKTVVDDVKKVV